MVEAGTKVIGATFIKPNPSYIEESGGPNLLGPFEVILRYSGLFCPKQEREKKPSPKTIFSILVAGFFLAALLCRSFILMNENPKPTTLSWAVSNVIAFMSLQSFISAVCVFTWCRAKFLNTFYEMLGRVRMLRIQQDARLEDYTSAHKKASILCLFIFIVTLTSSFNKIMYIHQNENATLSERPSQSPVIIIEPLLDFLSALSMSLAVTFYLFVNLCLNREVKHFNKELANAARFQQLTMAHMLNTYSKRQSDIIQLIKFSNEQMSKYTTIIPLFVFLAMTNAIYIVGGLKSEITTFDAVICIGWILTTVSLIAVCFLPAAKIQDNIKETAEILMHDDVLQSCGDEQQHRVYRVILDRCHHSNTKLYLMNAVPLTNVHMNLLMFIVPNLATLMVILKKLELF